MGNVQINIIYPCAALISVIVYVIYGTVYDTRVYKKSNFNQLWSLPLFYMLRVSYDFLHSCFNKTILLYSGICFTVILLLE